MSPSICTMGVAGAEGSAGGSPSAANGRSMRAAARPARAKVENRDRPHKSLAFAMGLRAQAAGRGRTHYGRRARRFSAKICEKSSIRGRTPRRGFIFPPPRTCKRKERRIRFALTEQVLRYDRQGRPFPRQGFGVLLNIRIIRGQSDQYPGHFACSDGFFLPCSGQWLWQ